MNGSTYVVRRAPGQVPLFRESKPRMGRLDIELTERCNNECIHCCINRSANDGRARSQEMSTEQIQDILQQAAGLGCLEVRLTGGEPLLRPDFEEVYLYARRLGMKVLIFSNARLITRRLAGLLARVPPLVPIEITIYGMSRESYEAVTRTNGSFAQFRRGVDLLLVHKVPFVLKTVVLPQNRHETDEVERWSGRMPWMTGPPNCTPFLDLRSRRDSDEKNALIKSLRLSPQDGLALLIRDAASYRREMADFSSRFMMPRGDLLFTCGIGRSMCIDAYGRAQPCLGVRAPELTVGLFARHSAAREGRSVSDHRAEASGGDVFGLSDAMVRFARFRSLRATNPEYLSRCARCILKGLCEQCPAKSWMEHGTLDTPVEYFCEIAHAQARYLGWLGGSEYGWEVEDRRKEWTNSMNRGGTSDRHVGAKRA